MLTSTNLSCLPCRHVPADQPLGFVSARTSLNDACFPSAGLRGRIFTMNTDNKIQVSSGWRDLNKQVSTGVRDVDNLDHFPALPGSVTQGTGERGLNRMSSSFKEVLETKMEAQPPMLNLEAYDDVSLTASPRISARPQLERMGRPGRVIEGPPQQVLVPPVEDGFQYPQQRRILASKSTSEEVPAAATTQDPFGIPEHVNPFGILADEPTPPSAEDPAYTFTEESDLRDSDTEGIFSRILKGAAKLSGRHCGRMVKNHPVATTAVAVVAVSAVRFLLLRRTR